MILDPTELTERRLEGECNRQMLGASPLWQKPLVVLFLRVLPTSWLSNVISPHPLDLPGVCSTILYRPILHDHCCWLQNHEIQVLPESVYLVWLIQNWWKWTLPSGHNLSNLRGSTVLEPMPHFFSRTDSPHARIQQLGPNIVILFMLRMIQPGDLGYSSEAIFELQSHVLLGVEVERPQGK